MMVPGQHKDAAATRLKLKIEAVHRFLAIGATVGTEGITISEQCPFGGVKGHDRYLFVRLLDSIPVWVSW